MKKKDEIKFEVNSKTVKKGSAQQSLREKIDETYVEVNQLSFKQNFQALIGHYKSSHISPSL